MTANPATSAFERWRRATLEPFSQRVFAAFWFATLVSSLGTLIQSVGASWLMATIAPSPDMVALVQVAGALPFFFFSLIAGAYADTHDRRATMLASQWLMLVVSATLAGLTLAGKITPALLLLLTFLLGCGSAAFAPAWQSSIGDQVPRAQIPSAVMANAVGFNLARSVGPAIGGVIVAAAGAAAAFVINAFSYIGMLATLLWWKPDRPRNALPPEPLATAIGAGVRYVLLSPHLIAILARCLLFALPMAAVPALMPIVARDLLGGGAPTFGVLLAGFGIGAMGAALSSAALRARYSSDAVLRAICVVAFVAMVVIGQSRWFALTLLAHVMAGSVWTLGLATFNITVQMSSPRWVTGRTLAIYQTIAFGGMALGSWGAGELATLVGLRETITAAGVAALGTLLVARWLPVAVASTGSLDPQATAAVRPPHVEIHDASGPIVVTITYRVPAQNAAAFLEIINELGRVRRRDGARRWSVCQDIDDPRYWVERFESPTWLDYLRRQSRPTQADQELRRRMLGLIIGEQGIVRRMVERPSGSEPLGSDPGRPEPMDDTSGHS
ncbi:MAG: MFS transporter [Steroidobacteraceae bacterium]